MSTSSRIEVEVKIAIADAGALIAKLRKLHAEKERSLHLLDTYYGVPGMIPDVALRLREAVGGGQWPELTVKGRPTDVGHASAREEHTARVPNALALSQILERTGLVVLASVEKHRTEFLLDDVPVYVDDVVRLGQFVEVGAPVLQRQVDAMHAKIAVVLRRLGLDGAKRVRKSYLQLALSNSRPENDIS